MSDVRSVTVHLHASVDGYIRDMRRAGKETDRAFASSHANLAATNRELGIASKRLGEVDTAGRSMNTTIARSNVRMRVLGEQSDVASKAMAGVRAEAGRLNGSGNDSIVTVGRNSQRTSKELDTMSGRMGLLAEAAITLGPALIPIGAAAVPALAGLTAGFGAAAGAAGVAVLALNGVGDALKAIDTYQLEPTQKNLQAMRAEFDKLGPAGAEFARFLDSLEPELRTLQDAAREGMFPGVEAGIHNLLALLPQVRSIISSVATEMGNLTAEAGAGLAGDGFASFFDYLETDAAPTLEAFGHTIGNLAEGFANLIVAFAPLSRDFTGGMESMSASFADWAAGLSKTQGFQDFVAYVRESGPQVIDLLGAMSSAFVGIVKAAAPVGHAVVPMLTALAHALGALADSPLGTPLFTAAAGLIAFNRAASLFRDGGALAKLPGLAKTAGAGISTLVGDFTLLGTTAMTAGAKTEREMARIADSSRRANMALASVGNGVSFVAILTGIGLVNEAFNSLRDTISTTDLDRNLQALARGAQVDDFSKLGQNLADLGSTMTYVNDKFSDVFTLGIDTSELENAQQEVEKVDQGLAAMVESGNADQAAAAYGQILKQAAAAGVSSADVAKAFDAYQTALANIPPAADEAGTATGRYKDYTAVAGHTAARTGTQIRGLVSAMVEQKSAALGAFDAVTQYAQALADARTRAKNTEAGIDASTAAGRKNRDSLSQLAAAWNNQSDAVRNNTAKFHAARQAFIDTAVAMGVPIQKARDLAQRLLEIPRQRVINIDARDMASAKIRGIKSQLDSIDRNVDIYFRAHTTRLPSVSGMGPQVASARGNLFPPVRAYAQGDVVNRHQPELAGPGPVRMWREPETRGEAYVPLANDDRRPRAKAILEQTAGIFGGRVEWYARGGWASPTQASSPGPGAGGRAASLAGLRIEGDVTVNGLDAALRGTIREEIDDDRRFQRVRAGG